MSQAVKHISISRAHIKLLLLSQGFRLVKRSEMVHGTITAVKWNNGEAYVGSGRVGSGRVGSRSVQIG